MQNVTPLNDESASMFIEQGILMCKGNWTLSNQAILKTELMSLLKEQPTIEAVDGAGISSMDSVGAILLNELIYDLMLPETFTGINGLQPRFNYLLKLAATEIDKNQSQMSKTPSINLFYECGLWVSEKIISLLQFFAFIGEFFLVVLKVIVNPRRIRWTNVLKVVETAGVLGLPIVGLMSFLIGIVLVYQLGTQLRLYGATIYVVQVAGIGIIREFAPLITAVIVAGRTSTSFAALIGSMKINEEIDALKSMGLPPFETLVLPRVIAMLIALPLLTVWADFFGVLGSMVMAKLSLGISFTVFINHFSSDIDVSHYVLGLIKTPIFSLIIACVGCFQGLKVSFGAQGVGLSTTKAAVQSIFLIIVADALFSILFSMMGL